MADQNLWWIAGGLTFIFGGCFAVIPLYKVYCSATGQGQAAHKEYAPPSAAELDNPNQRTFQVDFSGTVHSSLPWAFEPQQQRIVVSAGETALAFYRARNLTERPIIGVSVYHVMPVEAGLYFNKIQCFCFDEQLLQPGEEVDLPLLFFLDPEMLQDTRFDHLSQICLAYIFFESDSEIPEEYEEMLRARRAEDAGGVLPRALEAPTPEQKAIRSGGAMQPARI